MIGHLLTQIPLAVWITIAVAAIVGAYLYFGKFGATVAGAVAAIAIAFFAGRRVEQSAGKVEDTTHANDIQTRAEDARASVDVVPDSKLREPSPFQRD